MNPPSTSPQWFEVDNAGLAKILARRGKEFILFELIQNAWDEKATKVTVRLESISPTQGRLVVEDDNPDGFKDLTHAYTLFAPSGKLGNPEARGRFNLGEKMVVALMSSAAVESTTGTVRFTDTGRHIEPATRKRGTVFSGELEITPAEIEACERAFMSLIQPLAVRTNFNGKQLPERKGLKALQAVLPTEFAGDDGLLRRTKRKTTVRVFQPRPGETAMLYEMGIPVVETGDTYHVDISQKVPVNLDRDNVTPAYLAQVRALVLDAMVMSLNQGDSNQTWVKDAIQSHGDELSRTTLDHLATLRFGKKRVAFDPSDPEANNIAVSKGYTVVHGGNLSGEEWGAMKRVGAILPAGQVTPSPKPFHPDGTPLRYLPRSEWTPAIHAVADYSKRIAQRLIGYSIEVQIANDSQWNPDAVYGEHRLIFNMGRLGRAWFEGELPVINALLIHELAHETAGNHLSSEFYDACCLLGAKLAQLALDEPEVFALHQPSIEPAAEDDSLTLG